MKTRLILITISVWILASCQNQMELGNEKQMPVAAQVSGAIRQSVSSRAIDNQWEKDDKIGVSGISGGVIYTNLLYNYKENTGADFEPADGDIYYTDAGEALFTAYYPYNETGGILAGNVANQTESRTFDYLFAGKTTGSKEHPALNFAFSHKMCKVILNIVAGDGLADADFTQCAFTFSSLHSSGNFDTTTGNITFSDESPAGDLTFTAGSTISANVDENGKISYSFILFPEGKIAGGIELKLDMNDNLYGGGHLKTKGDDMLMESGKVYEYTVTVNQKSIRISKASFTNWTLAGGFTEEGKDVDAN